MEKKCSFMTVTIVMDVKDTSEWNSKQTVVVYVVT